MPLKTGNETETWSRGNYDYKPVHVGPSLRFEALSPLHIKVTLGKEVMFVTPRSLKLLTDLVLEKASVMPGARLTQGELDALMRK